MSTSGLIFFIEMQTCSADAASCHLPDQDTFHFKTFQTFFLKVLLNQNVSPLFPNPAAAD